MSRLATLLTALALALSACGGDGGGAAEPAEPEEEQIRVGLSADQGQLNDRGFNQLAHEGLQRAQRELGIRGRVLQAGSTAEYVPNMTTLARQGYDLIVAVGFAQGDAVNRVATQFPETRFLIIDVDQASLPDKPSNVNGMLFREEEVGYLAGYLAGLQLEREGGDAVIGSVGGFKEPPVDRFIAGYQAGARAALPGVQLLNSYSQDWDDQAKCKELALNQIGAGARVVFQVAGGCGLGALDAARERGVWGIGVDADQSFLGEHVLTSALKRVDRGVFLAIESVVEGEWQGGRNLVYGLAEDGVGLGTISSKVSKGDLDALEDVQRRIAAGELEIPRELP